MRKIILSLIACFTLAAALAVSAQTEPQRPKITDVAHGGYFVKDYAAARSLYNDFFGFEEAVVMIEEGKDIFVFVKINERQYVEVFPERVVGSERMYHFSVETDDADAMRIYLKSKGFDMPDTTPKGRVRNSNYFVTDYNGTICEITQYEQGSISSEARGKFLPADRISKRLDHVGFAVADLDKALDFYVGIMGFSEIWRDSEGDDVSCVHLKVPEGESFIQLLLHDGELTAQQKGEMNHIALEVEDIYAAKAILDSRTLPEGCSGTGEVVLSIDNRRSMNYYDTDGTRIQLVEAAAID